MLPRQSSDDDRPMGLKFTRNNFFNFPKRENTNNNSNSNEISLNRAASTSSNSSSTHQSPLMMRNFDDHHRNQLQQRNSNQSGYSHSSSSPPPVLSPTLPARSPFRIRDSQQAAAAVAATAVGSRSHDANSKSNSSLDEQPTIYSSISSSSSSSVATVEDDLSQELENIWKLKSNTAQQPQKEVKVDINSEDMLMQLLISHAVIDAREYKVLSFEEYETLKQHHARLKKRVQNSTAKLELDKKIQETSHSLSNLSFNKNRESVMLLLDEAVEADKKVKILTQRLNELQSEEVETQYQILKHTAGVLCLGLQKLENTYQLTSPKISSPLKPASPKNQLHDLHSQLDNITQTLKKILLKYDVHAIIGPHSTANDLLDQLEAQLNGYKTQSKQLESKLASAEEKSRLESMSEKKLAIQLKAAHEKNTSAEAKVSQLQQEIDQMMSKNAWLPQDDFDFADDRNGRIEQLESELSITRESQQRVERELELGYAQVAELKATVANMELQASKIKSQAAVFQNKEQELKLEVQQYRDEVIQLRTDKEKWERTMKRKTVMQVLNNEGPAPGELEAKYEQQLEEQEQEYQAQLKEQAAFLDKTTRQCEHLQQEHDKLSATCKDLELLIREKQKTLDSRDVQINQLESEIQQQKSMAKSQPKQVGGNQEALQQLQAIFSEKEAAWIEQSAAMEANFEGILKEFDRLTGTAMEFETDKMNYERRIEKLTQEVKDLESSLAQEKTKNLGHESDTPTTASLRKEFRKMITDMKADHQRTLDREAEEKRRLEKQLKDLKHEREMSRYERINKGVQTLFMA
ncbi:hypothetical protein HMPREF1544_00095 [Mucor circinelloides 1006PhL]|uniref:Up-regulated during septation protein 1 domain-containing protein n=1 Tax=Mucor circinelloides f. circinelloides (strain 1006PhL) TaxID=1220926 RepID=S2JS21_MUCC1|nr:hypothetical protein HMPREF1544_00095 [Mucor circinelloides 1006PhL]